MLGSELNTKEIMINRTIKFRGLIMYSGYGTGFVYGSLLTDGQRSMIRWMHNPLTKDYTDIEVKTEVR